MRQTYFLRGPCCNVSLIELIALLYSLGSIFLFEKRIYAWFYNKKVNISKNKHSVGQFTLWLF